MGSKCALRVELTEGMSAREILYKFKWRTLILFKALLLEKRVSHFLSQLILDPLLRLEDRGTMYHAVLSVIFSPAATTVLG